MLEILKGRDQVASDDKTGSAGLGQTRKPIIGLALGGGAARGFAHIGILRTLLKYGIVPDIVAGTSIGAVVGGCYAAGRLDELEAWALGLQRRSILGYLDFRLNSSGLIGGSKLAQQLEASLGDLRIEDLPLKLATVATEIHTGHEIWLTHGRLVDAMRASYALPGIFESRRIGDRWLVDGALVNPVPASVARALGAEIVIAANVSTDIAGHGATIAGHGPSLEEQEVSEDTPPKLGITRFFSSDRAMKSPERAMKREFLGSADRPGISRTMIDAFNIMQDRITRARLAGDPPDILISPRATRTGWFDFHRAAETIAHGERAAERAIESIEEAIQFLAPNAGVTTGARDED